MAYDHAPLSALSRMSGARAPLPPSPLRERGGRERETLLELRKFLSVSCCLGIIPVCPRTLILTSDRHSTRDGVFFHSNLLGQEAYNITRCRRSWPRGVHAVDLWSMSTAYAVGGTSARTKPPKVPSLIAISVLHTRHVWPSAAAV